MASQFKPNYGFESGKTSKNLLNKDAYQNRNTMRANKNRVVHRRSLLKPSGNFWVNLLWILTFFIVIWLIWRVLTGTVHAFSLSGIKDGFNRVLIQSNAGASLSPERKYVINGLADKLYESMQGVGVYVSDFVDAMTAINTDAEFIYLESVYGKRDGSNLREWIADQWSISQYTLQIINDNYTSKGMQTRI